LWYSLLSLYSRGSSGNAAARRRSVDGRQRRRLCPLLCKLCGLGMDGRPLQLQIELLCQLIYLLLSSLALPRAHRCRCLYLRRWSFLALAPSSWALSSELYLKLLKLRGGNLNKKYLRAVTTTVDVYRADNDSGAVILDTSMR
jgi:hypothetical protein